MDASNLVCDLQSCGNLSTVFGLKGSTKEKRCEEHILDLIRKEMTIYNISAYQFIQTAEDVSQYELRRKQVTAGLGNLDIVSSFYEAQLRTAISGLDKSKGNTLRLVEEYYAELTTQIETKFEQARVEMIKMKENLEVYMKLKEAKLSENEEILCRNLTDVAGFLKKLLSVGEAVRVQTQAIRSQIDWRLMKSLRYSPIDKDVKGASSIYLEEGGNEKAWFHYEKSLKLLSKGWNLLKTNQIEEWDAVVLGLILGEVLCLHFAKYDESEEVFRKCLEIEEKIDPNSTDISRIKNWLCANYYYSAKYGEAENLALQVLQSSAVNSQTSLTALYYYSSCQWMQGKTGQEALIQQYLNTSILCNTPETQLLKLGTIAMLKRMKGLNDEAESLYWEAQSLGAKNSPTSILTVDNCYQLGKLYDDIGRVEEAMRKYTDAQALYAVHYPASIQSACALYSLAAIFTKIGKLKEAEVKFLEAHAIFSTYYPKSLQRANNLRDLATLFTNLNRYDEAECIFLEAEELFSTFYPLTLSSAINYTQLTKLYHKMSRLTEAIEKCTKGKHIFSAHFSKSPHFAHNLAILANIYFEAGNLDDAEKHFRKALKLFKKVDPKSANLASASNSFGVFCREKGRKVEAERCFSDAYDIYSNNYPNSLEGAQNMLNMGLLYRDMGRREAAISFVTGAAECWRKHGIEKQDVEGLLIALRSDTR